MTHALIQRLSCYVRLGAEERGALHDVLGESIRTFENRQTLFVEHETPRTNYVIVDGWACRHKVLPDGRRQILSFLLPGDLCNPNMFATAQIDYNVSALSSVTVSEIGHNRFSALLRAAPRLFRAFLWDALVSASIEREWIVNVGRRDASERMAHLFVEMLLRLSCVGRTSRGTFDMPATHVDLADSLGITPVHVSRTLQNLRAGGMVELEKRRLSIVDLDRLERLAMFDRRYLYLGNEDAHDIADAGVRLSPAAPDAPPARILAPSPASGETHYQDG